MQQEIALQLKIALSEERFEAYRPTNGSDSDVICHYLWNLSLSESLICMLQTLEVVFRNTLHKSVGKALNSSEWILNGPQFLGQTEKLAIEKAKEDLIKQNKDVTEARMVAELHFGFWTSLADSRYDRLWPKIIKNAFPQMPNSIRTRGEISIRVNRVRKLRNAVFHHHSIWHWKNLNQQYLDGYTIIDWISSETAQIAKSIDRFPQILNSNPNEFKKRIPN